MSRRSFGTASEPHSETQAVYHQWQPYLPSANASSAGNWSQWQAAQAFVKAQRAWRNTFFELQALPPKTPVYEKKMETLHTLEMTRLSILEDAFGYEPAAYNMAMPLSDPMN